MTLIQPSNGHEPELDSQAPGSGSSTDVKGSQPRPCLSLLTAYRPGAVGIIQVFGSSVQPLLTALTGITDWPTSRMKLADLAGIDRGLVVVLRADWAQITPHGGVRVVGKIIDHLVGLGAVYDPQPPASVVFPESQSLLEADMLVCLATATSAAAIDLLLAQPSLWQRWIQDRNGVGPSWEANPSVLSDSRQILVRSDQFDRLVRPPMVVVVGRPNVGKSTLTNRILGRSVSLVADLSGTTRDWVAGLVQLSDLAVRWVDTPGLRRAIDTLEQHAIDLAGTVIKQADLLIAVCDPQIGWPDQKAMADRSPDLWVVNKIDQKSGQTLGQGHAASGPLGISARTGEGLDRFQDAILDHLGFAQFDQNALWAFSPTLREALGSQRFDTLRDYVGP